MVGRIIRKIPYPFFLAVMVLGLILMIYGGYLGTRWVNWKLSYEGKVEETVYEVLRKENLIK